MSSKPTAEERAEKRYPAPKYVPMPDGLDEIFAPDVRHTKQFAYADCIREEVEPLEAENVKLRALVQELVNHMQDGMEDYGEYPCFLNGLEEAKSQGFTPTNTTEG